MTHLPFIFFTSPGASRTSSPSPSGHAGGLAGGEGRVVVGFALPDLQVFVAGATMDEAITFVVEDDPLGLRNTDDSLVHHILSSPALLLSATLMI